MRSGKTYKPGEKTPRSGQYEKTGPRGGKTGEEITSTKGNTLPPSKPGYTFTLADPTIHKGDSKKGDPKK